MLKRTMVLLSLTITIGALLLVVGCGGHNRTMPFGSSEQPSLANRQENQLPIPSCLSVGKTSDGRMRIVVKATDPERDQVFFKITIWKDGQLFGEYNQKENPAGWQVFTYNDSTYGVFVTSQKIPAGFYQWQVGATDDKHNNPGEWALSKVYSMRF